MATIADFIIGFKFLTVTSATLCSTELFEIELFICIKMDLALNNKQKLIRHKTKQKLKTISCN